MPSKSGSKLDIEEDARASDGSVKIADQLSRGYHSDLAGLAISSPMAF